MKVADVHIGDNKNKVLFVLRTSKTHWKNVDPQTVKIVAKDRDITASKCTYTCQFKAICDYLAVCPGFVVLGEQFFVFADNSPVKVTQYRSTLKHMLKRANFDTGFYDMHSLCMGRATDLLWTFSVETIRKLGHWMSTMVYRYLK